MNITTKPFGFKDKIGYFCGDFANGLFFSLTASYLTLFYVDILGISAASVGLLLVLARVWDAINDPILGTWIDNQKPTPMGKFRPWILRMAIPVIIFGMLSFATFSSLLDAPLYIKLIYAYVTYIGFGMSYTAINIPYGSLASVISDNEIDRTSLSMFRSYGAVAASLTISMLIPIFVFDENRMPQAEGFFKVSVIFGILSMIFYTICYKLTTERIVNTYTGPKKIDLLVTMKDIFRNKPLLLQMFSGMTSIGVFLVLGTLGPYLFKDYFQNTNALVFNGLLGVIAMVIVSLFLKKLVAKFGKKSTAVGGLFIYSICSFLFFLLPITNVYHYFILMGIGMCGMTTNTLLTWAFIPDCIDNHEYLTGKREEGTIYAIYSFSRKIGQAAAGFFGAYVLIWVKYVANQPTQSIETVQAIKVYASLFPGIGTLIIAILLMLFYHLDKDQVQYISETLKKRRQELKDSNTLTE